MKVILKSLTETFFSCFSLEVSKGFKSVGQLLLLPSATQVALDTPTSSPGLLLQLDVMNSGCQTCYRFFPFPGWAKGATVDNRNALSENKRIFFYLRLCISNRVFKVMFFAVQYWRNRVTPSLIIFIMIFTLGIQIIMDIKTCRGG